MVDSRRVHGGLPALGAAILMASASASFGHSFEPALLDLREREAGVFDVVWKSSSTARTIGADVAPSLPSHCRATAVLGGVDEGGEGPRTWRADCRPAGLRGHRLEVSGLEGTMIDVVLRIGWQDGALTSAVLRSGAGDFLVPVGRAPGGLGAGRAAWEVASGYVRLGIDHILLGYDHLLFVLGLLLLVRTWGALVKTVSAFTVAHSLTLAVAVLGIVEVSQAPVEALIAASIVLLAAELARGAGGPPTLARRYPWLVAFGFGLLHGLGFAGALRDVGLPADRIPLALLAFNVGVEIGQLAFVAAAVAPVSLLAPLGARWKSVRLLPAYGIGALAAAWTIERTLRFWAPVG